MVDALLEKQTYTVWMLTGCLATMATSCGMTLLALGDEAARTLGVFVAGLSFAIVAVAAAIQLIPRLTPAWLTLFFLAAIAIISGVGTLAGARFTGDSVASAFRGLAAVTVTIGAGGAVVIYAVARRAVRGNARR